MALAALHRKVTVGTDDSLLLKVVYDRGREPAPLPCVLFFSGADCNHESYMWLAARLARAGCAVALSTCVVPFGPGTCLLSAPYDLTALESLDVRLHLLKNRQHFIQRIVVDRLITFNRLA